MAEILFAVALSSMAGSATAGAVAAGTMAASTAAILTSTASAVGMMAGGYLDQQFLFPAIFGGSGDMKGQRLDDLRVQVGSEGSPMMWCYGPENRIAGMVIWASDLKPVTKKKKVSKKKSQKYDVYYADIAIALCEGPISAVTKIWADTKVIYDTTGSEEKIDPRFDTIEIYYGGDDQDPDPTMEAALGVGNVPAYRGIAYLVIKKMDLTDFGNRLPSFNFVVEAQESGSISDGITKILKRAGWDDSYFNVDGVSYVDVKGFNISGPQPVQKSLESFMLFGNVIAYEDMGCLYFKQRTGSVRTLSEFHISATEKMTEVVPPVTFTDKSIITESADVVVKFFDPRSEYLTGSARSRKNVYLNPTVTEINLPMTITAQQAIKLANRTIWAQVAEFRTAEAQLPPSQMDLQEGDLINIPDGTDFNAIRISSMDIGFNGVVKISGTLEQSTSMVPAGSIDDGIVVGTNPLVPARTLRVIVLNIAPLDSAAVNNPGVYIAVSRSNPTDNFYGAALFIDKGGDIYEEYLPIGKQDESVIGQLTTTLATYSGDPETLDTTNTVTVEILAGELDSVNASAVANGVNWCYIGGEILGFQTATLVGPRTYELSNLWRGLRDTVEGMAVLKTVGMDFVLLEDNALNFVPITMGQALTMKALPAYIQLSTISPFLAPCSGQNVKPFRPFDIQRTSVLAATDLLYGWTRNSRVPHPIGAGGFPLEEPFEQYVVSFYEVGSTTVLRTKTVDSASVGYTAAEQTADGRSTPGDPLDIKVWQVGNFWSTGNFGFETNI